MTLYHVKLWPLLTEELLVLSSVHTKICLHKIVYVYVFGVGWEFTMKKKNSFQEKIIALKQ